MLRVICDINSGKHQVQNLTIGLSCAFCITSDKSGQETKGSTACCPHAAHMLGRILTHLITHTSKPPHKMASDNVPGNEVREESDQQEQDAQNTAQVGVAAKIWLWWSRWSSSWRKIL